MGLLLDGFTHEHITERELAHVGPCGPDDKSWEDCTPDATIMAWRSWGHPLTPATNAEGEQLRCAAGRGMLGGTNIGDMVTGLRARYNGAAAARVTNPADLLAHLVPGASAAVQGSMGAFAAGSHFRRWDPAFAGGHCAAVFRIDGTDSVWWDDPLAPEGTGYQGERMALADLTAYMAALPGAQALVGMIKPDPVPVGHELHIAAGVRTLYRATVTAETPPRISGWTTRSWGGNASSAPCDAPVVLRGTSNGSATVARVTRGAAGLVGAYVRVGAAWGVIVTP